MANRNQVSLAGISFAGIPVKERNRVKTLMHFNAAAALTMGSSREDPRTPQEVWAYLNGHWKNQREEREKKAQQEANERAARRKEHAFSELKEALDLIHSAVDIAGSIEREEDSYFDTMELGRFARLCIENAGKKMEQGLCDLGIIPESESPRFLEVDLKSRWLKAPEEEQKAA